MLSTSPLPILVALIPLINSLSPIFEIVLLSASIVLFVKVSVVALPTKVSVDVGNVRVPVFEILEIIGDVKVLLVSVSVVSKPTKVVVASGKVTILSAVGSPADNVNSKSSAVVPSNTNEFVILIVVVFNSV